MIKYQASFGRFCSGSGSGWLENCGIICPGCPRENDASISRGGYGFLLFMKLDTFKRVIKRSTIAELLLPVARKEFYHLGV